MAQVTIRNLEARIVDRLKKIAAANGRSLEAELRLAVARFARGEAFEEAPAYESRAAAALPNAQPFRPPRPVVFPAVTPLKVRGKAVSERLIEDRR